MLTVITLGSLELHLNDQPLHFRMSKAAVLLIYLMREADKPHGREQLATLLWPEETDHKSRENFRQALYQIRRALGDHAPTYLQVSQSTVQFLAEAPHALDANQFEQAVQTQAWTAAASLYLGEFLPTFYPSNMQELAEWQLMTREHLHQLAVQTFTQLARQNEVSDPLEARQYARRLLALEPWSEAGHRLLMRCGARLGNIHEALAQYEQCATILAEQLGASPTLKTTTLYEQIRDGRWQTATPPVAAPSQNQLPANLTPLIGREEELADLRQFLTQPECRLLTITGVGGIGKTKLLLNLGWACHHAQQYAGGVLFASLAELEPHTAEPVAMQITHYLVSQLISSVDETSTATAVELLQEAWHGREPRLLLLDNWEHLLEGATLLTDLLASLPQLTIVTTSRVPLNLYGEWLYPLHGLSATAEKGAVQLFAQAARRVQPHFTLDAASAEAVNTLCQALDGHPLALEMAAAALRGLTLPELLDEVTAGLDIFTTNQPNIPRRQQDMRHLLAASWRRLTEGEQPILAQLSLFRQPFSVAAAQAVTGARVWQMATIVAQAWLRRTAEGRYQSHELLRHFGREQLAQNPALEQAAKKKYTHYHLQWLADWAHKPLTNSMLTELTSCWADIILSWGEGIHQQIWSELEEAIPTLSAFYEYKGLLGEGIEWLAGAVKQVHTAVVNAGADAPIPAAAQRVHALLLIAQANLRNIQVRSAPVPDLMAEAIAIAERLADDNLLFSAKIALAHGLARLGQLTESIEIGLALLPPNNPAPSPLQQAHLWTMIGITYGELGEWPLSNKYLRQAVTYYEVQELVMQAATVRHNLALTLLQQGELGTARRLFVQNALFWRQHPSPSHKASTYEGLGVVWLRLERLALAERYLRRAKRMYEQLGDKDGLAYVAFYQGRVALARESWGQAEQLFLHSAELRQAMNMSYVLAQPWAGVALAAWREGNTAVAQTYFDKALPAVLASEVKGEEIAWVYKVMAELAQEMGHPQAQEIVAAGLEQCEK